MGTQRDMDLGLSSLHEKPSPDLKLISLRSRVAAEQPRDPIEPPAPLFTQQQIYIEYQPCATLDTSVSKTKTPALDELPF